VVGVFGHIFDYFSASMLEFSQNLVNGRKLELYLSESRVFFELIRLFLDDN